MQNFMYTIKDEDGVHARPAALLANLAKKYESKITIASGEKNNELKTVVSVMGLGLKKGDTVSVTVEGSDEASAAAALEQFFKENI